MILRAPHGEFWTLIGTTSSVSRNREANARFPGLERRSGEWTFSHDFFVEIHLTPFC